MSLSTAAHPSARVMLRRLRRRRRESRTGGLGRVDRPEPGRERAAGTRWMRVMPRAGRSGNSAPDRRAGPGGGLARRSEVRRSRRERSGRAKTCEVAPRTACSSRRLRERGDLVEGGIGRVGSCVAHRVLGDRRCRDRPWSAWASGWAAGRARTALAAIGQSASSSSCALAYRSAGSLARQRATTASSSTAPPRDR